jgi:hypothetical protein
MSKNLATLFNMLIIPNATLAHCPESSKGRRAESDKQGG